MNSRHFQRLQPHWDWRAAGNFISGGAGAGLAFFGALFAPEAARALVVGAGMALVGLGLFFVWLEIGRPLRALNVLLHLRTSWMSREAVAAMVLFALGLGLLLGMPWPAWPIAVAALAFLYCQSRILHAARAIPTWRHRLTLPLLILTGLAEGMGLFWLLAGWAQPEAAVAAVLALLVLARWLVWRSWRARLANDAAPAALRAIGDNARYMFWLGTVIPLALVALTVPFGSAPGMAAGLLAVAGLCSAAAGATFKFTLVTRTGHHHGFSLPRMPVRGVPRTAPH